MIFVTKATNIEKNVINYEELNIPTTSACSTLQAFSDWLLSLQALKKQHVLRQDFYIVQTALQCMLCPVIALLNDHTWQDTHNLYVSPSLQIFSTRHHFVVSHPPITHL